MKKSLVRRLRMMYALTAFSGALVIYGCGQHENVFAQTNDYAMESKIAINDSLVNQLDAKVAGNAHHLELVDARINDLSDKVSMIEGAASSAMAVLGILQIFGLIASAKANKV